MLSLGLRKTSQHRALTRIWSPEQKEIMLKCDWFLFLLPWSSRWRSWARLLGRGGVLSPDWAPMSIAGGRLAVSAFDGWGALPVPVIWGGRVWRHSDEREHGDTQWRSEKGVGVVVGISPEDEDSCYSRVYMPQAPVGNTVRSSNKHWVDLELSIMPLLTSLFNPDLTSLNHHPVCSLYEGPHSLHMGPLPTLQGGEGAGASGLRLTYSADRLMWLGQNQQVNSSFSPSLSCFFW